MTSQVIKIVYYVIPYGPNFFIKIQHIILVPDSNGVN